MLRYLNRFIRTIFMGTLVGAVLAAWFSPAMITYWFAPPVDIALTCKPAVEWGLSAYRKMLLFGGAAGCVITFVFVLARGSKRIPPPAKS